MSYKKSNNRIVELVGLYMFNDRCDIIFLECVIYVFFI